MSADGTIIAVAILPAPWPPPRQVELFSKSVGENRLTLSVEPSGVFVIDVERLQRPPISRRFGPVAASAAARVALVLKWSVDEIWLEVSGVDIPLATQTSLPIPLTAVRGGSVPRRTALQSHSIPADASEDERFFLNTLRDIEQKLVAYDRYALIRASGLIRQLLLEGLVHRANRTHRVPLTFTTIDFTTGPPGAPKEHWLDLDPDPFPGAATVTCSLDQFLAAPCLTWGGVSATVRDVISVCANAKGGVHLGIARTEREQSLLDWDQILVVTGEEPSLAALVGICRVTLVGLNNLVAALTGASTPPRP